MSGSRQRLRTACLASRATRASSCNRGKVSQTRSRALRVAPSRHPRRNGRNGSPRRARSIPLAVEFVDAFRKREIAHLVQGHQQFCDVTLWSLRYREFKKEYFLAIGTRAPCLLWRESYQWTWDRRGLLRVVGDLRELGFQIVGEFPNALIIRVDRQWSPVDEGVRHGV